MAKKSRIYFTIVISLVTTLFLCGISFFAVNASDEQDLKNNGTELIVKLEVDGVPKENAEISIYRVFELASDGNLTYESLTGKFKNYSIDNITDTNDLRNLAVTTEGFIVADNILSDYSVLTNNNGLAIFQGVPTGVYLVCCDKFNLNNTVVFPTSFFVTVDNDSVQAIMKHEKQLIDKKTNIEAIKVWQDGESTSRPSSITVALYCDGELYQKRVLSKNNNWKYKWDNLDASCKWTVSEVDVPANYKVSVSKQENGFVITNRTEEGTPKIPSGSLPQTGMLIWPIPILFIAGASLIIIGIFIKRKKNE